VLRPESRPEHEISRLWWWMLGGAVIGFSVIAAIQMLGWFRRHREGLPFGGGDRAATAIVVLLGVAVPILALSALFAWSDVFVLKTVAAPSAAKTRFEIRVIGHQWWWEVRYPGASAVTANEIHIPVRTPVRLVVSTADVIHSFWVPALNRKIDMIPGRTSSILLEADRTGVYRGTCSEFCGLQHAHMAMAVYADPQARYSAWLANQQQPARSPTTAMERRGQQVFLEEPCSGCHEIRGTTARGRVGPDLTHLENRVTIAARTLPNDPKHLVEWVRNPQDAKPGVKMPAFNALSRSDFRALLAYLESLR
jgi:cytochrome c oxidase subunit II